MDSTAILFVISLLAGFYMTWSIGANDVSNAIGTSVGSKALTLRKAVILAAIFEFSGAFFFGSHVTETIETGIVNTQFFQNPLTVVYGMVAVLMGAGTWLFVASFYGLPVSTTHSIIGAMVGFGMAIGGLEAIYWDNVFGIASSWILSPLIGGLFSYLFFRFIRRHIFFSQNPVKATKKIAPYIVFCLTWIFTVVFVYQDFESFEYHPSLLLSLFSALVIGIISFIVTTFWVKALAKKIPFSPIPVQPDMSSEIFKAKRYLSQLYSHTKADTKVELKEILERFDEVSDRLSQTTEEALQVPDFHFIEKIFGGLQIISACTMAFSHGANDVANAIGPLSVATSILLQTTPETHPHLFSWLLALGGIGIVVGLTTWGWRVVETVGNKITELTPTRGFSAEFGASTTILLMSRLGLPISATHTLVGAVLGIGFARGIEALNLSTIRDIILSWIVTIPIGALSALAFYYILNNVI